ncbi:expressed unknown protein [Seminavis robusta]|uniref:RING-type domain-containing protein n=1 Tax=Seminavis robusta TaxID=568900 RepID=A0A9N8E9H2_9STRA|nr:expressed unknown protein [Seminavis robusta]|eukprot:Sro695_g188730.1 n/a (364) ;mRNA; r:35138-36229
MATNSSSNTGKKHPRNEVDLTGEEEDEEDDKKPTALPRDTRSMSNAKAPDRLFRTDSEMAMALFESEADERPRKRAARMPTSGHCGFTCSICLNDEIENVEHQTYSLASCKHTFCFVCLEQLVQTSSAVGTATAQPIPCPMTTGTAKCSQSLTLGDIQTILQYSPKSLSLYSEASSMAFLEDQVAKGNARRCPNKHCNFTFEYEPEVLPVAAAAKNNVAAKKRGATAKKGKGSKKAVDKKKAQPKVYPNGCYFKCLECNSSYCLDCPANEGRVGPPHKGKCDERVKVLNMTAKERKQLKAWEKINAEADGRFRALLKRESKSGKTKACPKCFRLITKNKGCDHMVCTGCKKRFNWSSAPRFQG